MLRACFTRFVLAATIASLAAAQNGPAVLGPSNTSALAIAFNGDVVRFSRHITTAQLPPPRRPRT